jgi:hypothetical protein
MIFFFVAKLTDLFLGDDHFGELLRKFGGDLASGGLFVYVSFVFVAQIKFQVEDYLC